MGLGRGRRSDDQVSLLDVSARRFPFYLGIVETVVIVGLVLSIGSTVQQGKGWCLESLLYFLGAIVEYLNSYVSGAILGCGAIEGFIVGITKVLLRQTKQQALEEGMERGRQEGIQIERERLRRAGIEGPPDPTVIVRDKSGYFFVMMNQPPRMAESLMAVVYCDRGETILIDERKLRHVLDGERHDYEPGWLVLNAHDAPEGLKIFLGVGAT